MALIAKKMKEKAISATDTKSFQANCKNCK